MRMRPHDETDPPIDESPERLFLAGRLCVEIDNDDIGTRAQGAGQQLLIHRAKRTIEFMHINPAHRVHDENLRSVASLIEPGAAPRRPGNVTPVTLGKAAMARVFKSFERQRTEAAPTPASFVLDLDTASCTRPIGV